MEDQEEQEKCVAMVDQILITDGGAGNPGGQKEGSNGTGGLLIIYANEFINNGTISCNGSNGGPKGGGGSGGGSLNIFYKVLTSQGTMQTNGGTAGTSGPTGGAGGTGSISMGNISTGTYVSTYKNY